jgi:MFS transporter, DHA2 family, multidrug resistance protein
MNTSLSSSAGDQFFLPKIVRAIGRALVITPVSAVTTAGILPKDAGASSGLSNMMRNLGGAVGTATLGTVLTKREQFHSNIIGQSITLTRDEVRSRPDQMTGYFMAHGVSDRAAATARTARAIVAIGAAVRRQALIVAFSDAFAVIRVLLAIAAVSMLFARKPQAAAGAGTN